MSDDYTNTMRKHYGNCFQSFGFSQTGADQLARQEQVSDPVDQAMLKAYVNDDWQTNDDPMNTDCWIDSKPQDLLKVGKPKPNDLLADGGNGGLTNVQKWKIRKNFGW